MACDALHRVFDGGPWNVLLDRSRDFGSGEAILRLAPEAVFRVTEARRALPPRRHRDYDIAVVCSNGLKKHSPAAVRALSAWVRRGGGLVLAACPGGFELQSQRPIEDLGLSRLAARFGCRFLSAAALPPDEYGYRGYGRARLELTAAGRRLTGLQLGDCYLGRAGGLALPPGATVLMRDRVSGTPVMALLRFGRGKVLACADLAAWNDWNPFVATLLLTLVAPRRRARTMPPLWLDAPSTTLKRDGIHVRHAPGARRQAQAVLRAAQLARASLPPGLRPRSKRFRWTLELHPGLGVWPKGMSARAAACHTHVGRDVAPAFLLGALTRLLAEHRFYEKTRSWKMDRGMVASLAFALEVACLERNGFAQAAEHLRQSCAGGPRVDLGKYYSESKEQPQRRRFWLDLVKRFGPATLPKVLRVLTAKDTLPGVLSHALWSGFDLAAWFLARALGQDVYDWLTQEGHTVRRIPLGEPKSPKWKRALDKALEVVAADPQELPDVRCDALRVLARRLDEEKVTLDRCARRCRSARPVTALAAAVRLSEAKDGRAREALRGFPGPRDRGLAAVAALRLVFDLGDRAAAGPLAKLAPRFGARFQLAAGYALRLLGHPAARRFAFDRLPGCRLRVVKDGLNKAFAEVDGYGRANVWSMPQLFNVSFRQAHSTHYMRWVYTDRLWRRRGLARAAMAGCLASGRWDRLCSTTSLHTGVENVAHALYRSFDLHDITAFTSFKKELSGPLAAVRPPRGIVLRRAEPRDARAAAAFLGKLFEHREMQLERLAGWPEDVTAWLACARGKIVGLAAAEAERHHGNLQFFGVAELKDKPKKKKKKRADKRPRMDRRERTAQALLSALHRALKERDVKEIEGATWRLPGDKFTFWQLRRAGYGTFPSGGVELHRLNSLPQFLRETRRAFEQRLKASRKWRQWHGRVRLTAGHESAVLNVRRGRVAVEAPGRGPADVEVRGDRGTFVKMLLGSTSPFASYLQLSVRAGSGFNDQERELLDVLFPKLYAE